MPIDFTIDVMPKGKKVARGGVSQILSVSDGQSEIESGSVLFSPCILGCLA